MTHEPSDDRSTLATDRSSPEAAVASNDSDQKPDKSARHALGRQTFLIWLLAATVSGIWSIGTPFWSSPDSVAHEMYAYSLTHGHLWPERTTAEVGTGANGAVTPVPEGLFQSAQSVTCMIFQRGIPASCIKAPTANTTPVEYVNPAGRYLPLYYFVSGLPTLLVDQVHAVWAMRIIPIALSALLISWAVTGALTFKRRSIAAAGVIAALSPMVIYLTGVLNPNSAEICGMIALCACSLAFINDPDSRIGQIMLRRAMLAAFIVATTRLLSPVWIVVWFLAFAALSSKSVWVAMFRWINLKWVLLAFSGCVLSVVWLQVSGLSQFQNKPQFDYGLSLRLFLSQQWMDHWTVSQEVGSFGWLDTLLPQGSVNLYFFTAVFMIVASVVFLRFRQTAIVIALALTQYFLPLILQAIQWNTNGAVWQGRYSLPLTVLVPITALFLASRTPGLVGRARRNLTWMIPSAVTILMFVQIQSYFLQLRRNAGGLPNGSITQGPWQPKLPPLLLVAMLVVCAVLIVVLVARLAIADSGLGSERTRTFFRLGRPRPDAGNSRYQAAADEAATYDPNQNYSDRILASSNSTDDRD